MFPAMGGRVARAGRRRRGEGSIYKDEAKGRWYAAVSVGYGPDGKTWRRHKISGRTRAAVAATLRELQAEQDSGMQPTPGYTVWRAVNDWLAKGLDGRVRQDCHAQPPCPEAGHSHHR
jgi:ribosomal protein L32E